jgi:tetratricopeptide (TPR) repeat protein
MTRPSPADATAAARARPGWAKAWIRVGEAATGLGRWSEAVTAYDRAVALQPGDEKAQIALARARGAESRAVSEGKVTFVKRAAPAPAAAARQAPPDAKRARPAAGKLSFADEEDEEDE